ncbi:MAG: DrmE family protein, partial [Chitinispirillia bacterium]|nr:DrmE family protein [Chitinispirillia bacterium]
MSYNSVLGLLKKCDILFENEVISNRHIMSSFSDFIIELMDGAEKNNGFIYHTGSPIFDLLQTLYMALSCLVYDELTPQELIMSFNVGDIVEYGDGKGKTRAVIRRIENECIKIEHKGTIREISPAGFYKIKPYQGKAKTLDGRGIRTGSNAKIEFMQAVFGKSKFNIPGINKKSAVIVCNKDFADSFVKGINIRYKDSRCANITDLMPISYFSENKEYPYSGNSGMNKPVLRFTNKVSIARELVYMDEEKHIFAVAVLGGQIIKSGESELPDLINRSNLKNVHLSLPIAEDNYNHFEKYSNTGIFVCTKDMLLSHSIPVKPCGPLTREIELQITNILNRKFSVHDNVESIIDINEYKSLRQNIASIRHYSQNDEAIDRFIIESCSLLNFLSNIPFSLDTVQSAMQCMGLKCPSARERLDFLAGTIDKYTDTLSNLLSTVFNTLNKAFNAIKTDNPKNQPLIDILSNALRRGTVLVLVPKSFYIDIFKALLPANISSNRNLNIKTTGLFDFRENYGTVVITGCFNVKRFSIFSTFVAPTIECLMYPHERPLFIHQKNAFSKKESVFNYYSKLKFKISNEDANVPPVDTDIPYNQEIDDYLEQLTIKSALQTISNVSGGTTTKADIVRVATTTDGESIFFSKYFAPYIFDRDQMTVIESEVKDIANGDMLLFTKNCGQTKDIVEEITQKIADSDKQIKEAFRKSKH